MGPNISPIEIMVKEQVVRLRGLFLPLVGAKTLGS